MIFFSFVSLRSARLAAGVLLLSAALNGCSSLAPQAALLNNDWPADLPQRAELTEVPFFPQIDYQCGPAALATSMANFNVAVTAEQLVPQVYLPARQGSLQVEMLATPRRYGLVSYQLAPSLENLLREVAAGTPVGTLQNLHADWHEAVAVGYGFQPNEWVLRCGVRDRRAMRLWRSRAMNFRHSRVQPAVTSPTPALASSVCQ